MHLLLLQALSLERFDFLEELLTVLGRAEPLDELVVLFDRIELAAVEAVVPLGYAEEPRGDCKRRVAQTYNKYRGSVCDRKILLNRCLELGKNLDSLRVKVQKRAGYVDAAKGGFEVSFRGNLNRIAVEKVRGSLIEEDRLTRHWDSSK